MPLKLSADKLLLLPQTQKDTQREWIKLRFGYMQLGHIQIVQKKTKNKCIKIDIMVVCIRVVWKTVDKEKYSKRLSLRSIKQLILFENQNVDLDW